MKNTFLFIFIFLIAIVVNPMSLSAQQVVSIRPDGYTPEKRAEDQTNWMTRRLALTSTLTKAVYQINLKYLLQTDSLRMTTAETVKKPYMHSLITQKKNAELQSVLSSEQYIKYQTLFANAKRYSH